MKRNSGRGILLGVTTDKEEYEPNRIAERWGWSVSNSALRRLTKKL
jgi:hypothetical protein